MRRAKIVATLGPSSRSPEMLERLIRAGLDVARLNFSHGTHEYHRETLRNLRAAAERVGKPVGVLCDLQGPKIRVGEIEGGQLELVAGQELLISVDASKPGRAGFFPCDYPGLVRDVREADPILLDDGKLRLRALSVSDDGVRARVEVGGTLLPRKGINLPGTPVSLPSMTEKDEQDLEFALREGVDFVALSFVRSADDVRNVKKKCGPIPVIAKIEKPQAVAAIESIASVAEGCMVARGDLGVEMPIERVPLVQKTIIEQVNMRGRIVIVATQMLESMIKAPVPTRAEVSDVANAILDGADAVMLSGETASGQYPLETVEQMARIIEEVERSARYQSLPEMLIDRSDSTLSTAVARACAAAARQLGLPVIAAYTRSGETVRLISEHRPAARLVAFTPSASARRRMSLYWGVESVLAPVYKTTEEMVAALDNMIRDRGYAKPGDAICIASPSPPDRAGGIGASMMQIQRL